MGLKVVVRLLLLDLMNMMLVLGKCVSIWLMVLRLIDVFFWIVVCG